MLLILLFVTLSTLVIYYYKKRKQRFTYWQQRGFPTLDRTPHWFFGDFRSTFLGKKNLTVAYEEAHSDFKQRGHKLGGMYMLQLPILLITDNELAKRILQTDFDSFGDRGITVDPVNNPLSIHMFALGAEPWQILRKKLSQAFTGMKIKLMLPIVEKHVDTLIKVTNNLCKSWQDINYHEWLDKTGVDVIAHVAFGLDCNTLESENEVFFEMTQKIMRPDLWGILKILLLDFKNPADLVLLMSSNKEISDFFVNLVKETMHCRRENNIQAMDFLQLLIQLFEEDEKNSGAGLTMIEVAAQAFLFFVAGFETTSRTILFALYALAEHQDEQELLRESVRKDLENAKGVYEYDWIMNNERLDMVIKETLRLYPPAINLARQANRNYHIPELNLTIPVKTSVIFSSYGFHHDPDYFPNPLEFKPDRFSKENVASIPPFAYLPFGEGPRFCIAKNFGYLQSKLALAKIIMKFYVIQSHLTEYPLKISPVTKSVLLTPKNPIYFKFIPL